MSPSTKYARFSFIQAYILIPTLYRQLSLKNSYNTMKVLILSFQRILDLLPSLKTVYSMPCDLLYNQELVACIAAHPNLHRVEVSSTPLKARSIDSRKPSDHLPCTPVYRYHLNLQPLAVLSRPTCPKYITQGCVFPRYPSPRPPSTTLNP